MGKSARRKPRRKGAAKKPAGPGQRVLPLAEVLVNTQHELRELVISSGLQVLAALLEEDRTALCGPRYQHNASRTASRYGHDEGQLVLGGRKISVSKPRVRSVEDEEIPLPSWQRLSAEDPLSSRVLEQMLIGVSTRQYERSLEPLPDELASTAAKKSSVSRRFVARTSRQVKAFLGRSLEGLDLPVLMIDGTPLGDHLLLTALGIDHEGHKHVLSVREGTTESAAVCRSLLRDLIGRGLVVERPRLVVIDGSKGIRCAVREVFGRWAKIQRCQYHKEGNVLDHLPERRQEWVKAKMRRAWEAETPKKARRQLLELAKALQEGYPGAADSLREGLDETLTIIELGVEGALYKTLRSTNPIENLHESMKRVSRRVKRWRSGFMALRWAVTGVMEAEKGFRRIRGYRDLPRLLDALAAAVASPEDDDVEKAA